MGGIGTRAILYYHVRMIMDGICTLAILYYHVRMIMDGTLCHILCNVFQNQTKHPSRVISCQSLGEKEKR